MRISPQGRRSGMLTVEGQLLSTAGSHGDAIAGDCARCTADGALNALIRIEGPEAAAMYAFALADRVAGGLKVVTAFPAIAAPTTAVEPGDEVADEPDEDETPPVDTRADVPWWLYYAGMMAALVAGIVIGMGVVR